MASTLPYDITSAASIFEYSKGLLGGTLRPYKWDGYKPKKGKGSLGQMVENLYFLLETNSNPAADFSEAGLELKCTPLKYGAKKDYLIKERLVCGMIDYCSVVNDDFESSHFYEKCQLMLLLFYLHIKDRNDLDLEFIFSVLWKLPAKDLAIIRHDYEIIVEKIRRGEAHLLSEGDTMYLGACRKGQKGDGLAKQPYSDIGAPRRAFSLKMAYMRTILKYVEKSGTNAISNITISQNQLVNPRDLQKDTFEQIMLKRFAPYMTKDYKRLAQRLKVNISKNPKNRFALIANAIAGKGECTNVNQSEEFEKAGLTMKTIRVKANGIIKEAMSFENINYMEVAECEDWYESRLYEIFSSRFMFVIFREQTKGKGDYALDDVFFWTMPQSDLDYAESYWDHIRECVEANHISDDYWWKAADRKKFHVRPKATKAINLTPSPHGLAKKYCYWFNNDYVREIVAAREEEKRQ